MELYIACPGCDALALRRHVACPACWRTVPGEMKGRLQQQRPGTIGAARVVGEIRAWLKVRRTQGIAS